MRAAKYRIARRSGGKVCSPKSDDAPAVTKKPRPAPISVDGAPARMRLDRPMRKRADGGWVGEGDSGRHLRERSSEVAREANKDAVKSAVPIGAGLGILAGTAGSLSKAGRVGRLVGAGLTAAGVPAAVKMFKGDAEEKRLNKAADEAEGRKGGGAIKKR